MIAKMIDSVNSDIRGKNFYTALELEKQGHKILKLNTGNPATFGFGMPDSVRNALIENMDKAVGYCDVRGMIPAREAIMQYQQSKNIRNFSMDDIFIGNGVVLERCGCAQVYGSGGIRPIGGQNLHRPAGSRAAACR